MTDHRPSRAAPARKPSAPPTGLAYAVRMIVGMLPARTGATPRAARCG
ncbi:hypothetical protein [Streptomyces sp. NPDC059788]